MLGGLNERQFSVTKSPDHVIIVRRLGCYFTAVAALFPAALTYLQDTQSSLPGLALAQSAVLSFHRSQGDQ